MTTPQPPPRGSSLSRDAVSQRRAHARASRIVRRTPVTYAAATAAERVGERAGTRVRARYAARQYGAQAAYVAQRGQVVPGDRQYQPVILAEFVAAELIVALAPIAQPSGGGSGPSPYNAEDLKQIVAIGAAYFVLALVASGNRGRLAAWFGGLILIGVVLSKVKSGQLKAVFSVVGQGPAPPPVQAV